MDGKALEKKTCLLSLPIWYCTDLKWDTDGEDQDELGLPSEDIIPGLVEEELLEDYLSETYGWCIFPFYYERTTVGQYLKEHCQLDRFLAMSLDDAKEELNELLRG